MHPQMDRLRKLPPSEKLQLVEELWDNLASSPEPLPLPQWHREEAQKRAAEFDADSSIGISREEKNSWSAAYGAMGLSPPNFAAPVSNSRSCRK